MPNQCSSPFDPWNILQLDLEIPKMRSIQDLVSLMAFTFEFLLALLLSGFSNAMYFKLPKLLAILNLLAALMHLIPEIVLSGILNALCSNRSLDTKCFGPFQLWRLQRRSSASPLCGPDIAEPLLLSHLRCLDIAISLFHLHHLCLSFCLALSMLCTLDLILSCATNLPLFSYGDFNAMMVYLSLLPSKSIIESEEMAQCHWVATILQLSINQLFSFLLNCVCSPLLFSGLVITGVV